jgi:hypothetical protein
VAVLKQLVELVDFQSTVSQDWQEVSTPAEMDEMNPVAVVVVTSAVAVVEITVAVVEVLATLTLAPLPVRRLRQDLQLCREHRSVSPTSFPMTAMEIPVAPRLAIVNLQLLAARETLNQILQG